MGVSCFGSALPGCLLLAAGYTCSPHRAAQSAVGSNGQSSRRRRWLIRLELVVAKISAP